MSIPTLCQQGNGRKVFCLSQQSMSYGGFPTGIQTNVFLPSLDDGNSSAEAKKLVGFLVTAGGARGGSLTRERRRTDSPAWQICEVEKDERARRN